MKKDTGIEIAPFEADYEAPVVEGAGAVEEVFLGVLNPNLPCYEPGGGGGCYKMDIMCW